jgi:hypothetical protein
MNSLFCFVRDTVRQRWGLWNHDARKLEDWQRQGRPLPPPPVFKQQLIRDLARRHGLQVLVETGTYSGATVAACLGAFARLYSVELSAELHAAARRRFALWPKVKLYQGDSARELARILDELREPALFWLDAHYSGQDTARADSDTPVVQELQMIARHPVRDHVILIDDARLFDGTNGYPTLESCRRTAQQCWPLHGFSVAEDVIRIVPE